MPQYTETLLYRKLSCFNSIFSIYYISNAYFCAIYVYKRSVEITMRTFKTPKSNRNCQIYGKNDQKYKLVHKTLHGQQGLRKIAIGC